MPGIQTIERTKYPGVYRVHERGCGLKDGARCRCAPKYRAAIYSAREQKSIRKHFDTLGAARTWREDAAGAVRAGERAYCSTAFYAALRRGELRALRWIDADFVAKVIGVERGWDEEAGEIEVKSDARRRTVPLAGPLRTALALYELATGRDGDALVGGRPRRTGSRRLMPTRTLCRELPGIAAERRR